MKGGRGGGGKKDDAAVDVADADATAAGARLRLQERVRVETEVKKSRFVAIATPVDTPAEAMRFFSDEGDASASHNCFAYKIGDDYRSSDDGEPGG